MDKLSILQKKKLLFLLIAFEMVLAVLCVRIFYLQYFEGGPLQEKAYEQQTRDRLLTPRRGEIFDRNMNKLATTESVASVSVIYNQMTEREKTAKLLAEILELEYEDVLKKVNKRVALERIKTKVPLEVAEEIRKMNLDGVIVDEDIKRVYLYSSLASQVIGFVGRDNQGIIGLEAKYDSYLKGKSGKILTETDVKGRELPGGVEERIEPETGDSLVISIDVKLQQYAEQILDKAMAAHNAKRTLIVLMDPTNGEIITMANKPDFDLNTPFEINDPALAEVWEQLTENERNDALNRMWRNFSINDTYEPGSSFKVVTSAAGLEEKVVELDSSFSCSGSLTVGGRVIKCWRSPRSHGHETFVEGVYNSCNPVFMEVAARLGADTFYRYMLDFGFKEKTGIDVPGEAVGIMHKLEGVGPVELATMSFGQSFQITPMQLLRAGAAVINGGHLITPHFGIKTIDGDGNITNEFEYEQGAQVISQETSDMMREILEGVVYAGTGNKTYIPGFRVGGKTATSEKLPRRSGKYIASFLAFAPAEDPKVIALVLIDEPQGAYYGGQVAGPIMKEILENALPYLNIDKEPTDEEIKKTPEAATITVPGIIGMSAKDAEKLLKDTNVGYEAIGTGAYVVGQFPLEGEAINSKTKMLVYLGEI